MKRPEPRDLVAVPLIWAVHSIPELLGLTVAVATIPTLNFLGLAWWGVLPYLAVFGLVTHGVNRVLGHAENVTCWLCLVVDRIATWARWPMQEGFDINTDPSQDRTEGEVTR